MPTAGGRTQPTQSGMKQQWTKKPPSQVPRSSAGTSGGPRTLDSDSCVIAEMCGQMQHGCSLFARLFSALPLGIIYAGASLPHTAASSTRGGVAAPYNEGMSSEGSTASMPAPRISAARSGAAKRNERTPELGLRAL
jgi:hypothetical protein